MKFGYSLYPAGEYYVGDLCYIFGKKLWKEVCDNFFDKSNSSGYMSLSNGCILTCLNSGGDAEFQDQHHRKYAVDSGTLGIILKASIDEEIRNEQRIFIQTLRTNNHIPSSF